MTQAAQTAETTDARQASMSRVETQETVLAKLTPQPASEAAPQETKESEQNKDGEAKATKKPASERIRELIAQREQAEAKAQAKEREAAELRARLETLAANATPLAEGDRPIRSQFASDDEYIEALADYKAREAIRKREEEAVKARNDAEQAEIAAQWSKRQTAVMKVLPDYAEVIGASEIQVPNHVHAAILESDVGPQIAYYLALHPDEAKRIAQMPPIRAVKHIAALERDLEAIEREPEPVKEAKEAPQKSKAPEPITPPRSAASSSGSGSSSFEEYKRRRQAEMRK